MADGDSFAVFCAQAYPRLVAALAHQTGDAWLAEELAQEALIRAANRWKRVGRLASPVGWTFAVGANLGRSHFRRRRAEKRSLARLAAERAGPIADAADAVAVRTALLSLPRKQREAVVLRYYLQLTAAEAAEVLGSTPGAVRGLTHRAVAALRLRLALLPDSEEAKDVS